MPGACNEERPDLAVLDVKSLCELAAAGIRGVLRLASGIASLRMT